jgi:hypothetical protein
VAKPIEGNVLADASSFLQTSNRVKIEDQRGNLVWNFRTTAAETLIKFIADRDYKIVRCWSSTATSYIAKSQFTSSNEPTQTGLRQNLIVISGANVIYEVNMPLFKGETLFMDFAASSQTTILLRPVFETDGFDNS